MNPSPSLDLLKEAFVARLEAQKAEDGYVRAASRGSPDLSGTYARALAAHRRAKKKLDAVARALDVPTFANGSKQEIGETC